MNIRTRPMIVATTDGGRPVAYLCGDCRGNVANTEAEQSCPSCGVTILGRIWRKVDSDA